MNTCFVGPIRILVLRQVIVPQFPYVEFRQGGKKKVKHTSDEQDT